MERWAAASRAIAVLAFVGAGGCRQPNGEVPPNSALTPASHVAFPIATGPHAVSCNTCHGGFDTFRQFDCLGCHAHEQQVTDELHRGVPTTGGAPYAYASASCYACHASGARVPFDHAGVTSSCATCHGTGAAFDPLPVKGVGLDGGSFVHPDMGGNDCRACHTVASWLGAGGAPDGARDPSQDAIVQALIPSYAGTSIATLAPLSETLPMPMVHSSKSVPAGVSCISCHAGANAGTFFPGLFHPSIAVQPAACLDCHAGSVPVGFVGPTDTTRTPPSGEMKHDAVLWSAGKPTRTPALAQECSTCHLAGATWSTALQFHAQVAAQPSSCLDCHANSRPGIVTSTVPAWQLDHSVGAALGDCMTCHQAGYTSWKGGRFHIPANGTPTTCLPCHEGERPTATVNAPPWAGDNSPPFDRIPNAAGTPHGGGQDCIVCHAGSATTRVWSGGSFAHGSGTLSATTCVACHATDTRPDLHTPSFTVTYAGTTFDHATQGAGDCFGCHQATVARGSYASYTVGAGGDWSGGIGYPGSTLISDPSQHITVQELTLVRSGPNNLVTGTTQVSATLQNAMLHTSAQVPPSMRPASSTDWPRCALCHAVSPTDGSGTWSGGLFHSKVTAQPTQCLDCHAQMRPSGIVEQGPPSDLQPMDHAATFTSGASVATMECATCHASPGSTWADGVFHANVGNLRPQDCTVCHYPLMADAAKSDVIASPSYAMQHRSTQLTFQNCAVCHTSALAKATSPPAASLFNPGAYHSSVSPQPLACNECHSPISKPSAATQSTVSYTLALGATSTNQRQWMSHASPTVLGKDCAVCHAADAAPGATAWSRSDSYHAAISAPASCADCHGTANGGGPVIGTNNNLPVGLTNASMVSSAASDPSTGVPVGTHDQITHADINVTGHDCNFCHTQPGTTWAQASFHTSFSGANPLIMNRTTGRCSDCHMNVKPSPSFPAFDHSALTAASGTQDCNQCHTWPGTGTASSPNWLGATGAPTIVTLTGFTSPTTDITYTGNSVSFSHPAPNTYTSCAQCHLSNDFTRIIDYNHDGLTTNVSVNGVPVVHAPNLGSTQYNASTNPTFCVYCHDSGGGTGNPWVSRTGLSSTIAASTTSGSTSVTTVSTAALTAAMTISGSGIPSSTTSTQTFTGTTTAGSVTVTTATAVSLQRGTAISGVGIPAGDTVAASVSNATSFNLTAAATASGTNTLTATTTNPLTVTIVSIDSATAFTISTAANATNPGTTLTVTHKGITQFRIGSHGGSTSGQDCTSCHYTRGSEHLTPPTPGVFGSGSISGG